jgi:pimeloyl-ACP methyl ester carboxylesterase
MAENRKKICNCYKKAFLGVSMIDTVLNSFFGLALAGGAIAGSAYFWTWYYGGPTSQDETVNVVASDGWRLAIHHYRSRGPVKGLPIVLCHGLSSNRYIFDLPGAVSLARWLAERGRDVWVPELRGSGMSERPGIARSDVPYSWEFDDHLEKDIPALIAGVLEQTGARAVHWVGHSMGGMLVLAHLAASDSATIASALALGSPTDFSRMKTRALETLMAARPLLKHTPIMPLPLLGRLVLPLFNGSTLGFFHAGNTDPDTSRKTVALASEVVTSSTLWLNFGRFVETKRFAPKNGALYLESLPASDVPIMVIAGAKDSIAPPESVVWLSSPPGQAGERRSLVLGKASGCAEDYGHVDLLMGRRVTDEVYPTVLQWVEEHDARNAA